jgi:hypothetical protein
MCIWSLINPVYIFVPCLFETNNNIIISSTRWYLVMVASLRLIHRTVCMQFWVTVVSNPSHSLMQSLVIIFGEDYRLLNLSLYLFLPYVYIFLITIHFGVCGGHSNIGTWKNCVYPTQEVTASELLNCLHCQLAQNADISSTCSKLVAVDLFAGTIGLLLLTYESEKSYLKGPEML